MLESITRHGVLSTRNASVAFGEYELDRFLEACLHEDDDDDNLAPVNQVSFKDLEMFIGDIKKRFNCAPKKEKSIIIQEGLDRL